MCEYYKSEYEKSEATIKELRARCEAQDKRIQELEAQLNIQGGFPIKMEE